MTQNWTVAAGTIISEKVKNSRHVSYDGYGLKAFKMISTYGESDSKGFETVSIYGESGSRGFEAVSAYGESGAKGFEVVSAYGESRLKGFEVISTCGESRLKNCGMISPTNETDIYADRQYMHFGYGGLVSLQHGRTVINCNYKG
jgi:hypothetical protein